MTKEKWKEHFIHVSEIMGEYDCQYWNLPYNGDYWQIVGKNVGYVFHSLINGGNTKYYDLDIVIRELTLLEPQTRDLLEIE